MKFIMVDRVKRNPNIKSLLANEVAWSLASRELHDSLLRAESKMSQLTCIQDAVESFHAHKFSADFVNRYLGERGFFPEHAVFGYKHANAVLESMNPEEQELAESEFSHLVEESQEEATKEADTAAEDLLKNCRAAVTAWFHHGADLSAKLDSLVEDLKTNSLNLSDQRCNTYSAQTVKNICAAIAPTLNLVKQLCDKECKWKDVNGKLLKVGIEVADTSVMIDYDQIAPVTTSLEGAGYRTIGEVHDVIGELTAAIRWYRKNSADVLKTLKKDDPQKLYNAVGLLDHITIELSNSVESVCNVGNVFLRKHVAGCEGWFGGSNFNAKKLQTVREFRFMEYMHEYWDDITETLLDKDYPPYEDGKPGYDGPDIDYSIALLKDFTKLLASVAKQETLTQESLVDLYKQNVATKFMGVPQGNAFMLSSIPKVRIEYPKSGWFGPKLKQIESELRSAGTALEQVGDKINNLKESPESSKYIAAANKLANDWFYVVRNAFDFACKLADCI